MACSPNPESRLYWPYFHRRLQGWKGKVTTLLSWTSFQHLNLPFPFYCGQIQLSLFQHLKRVSMKAVVSVIFPFTWRNDVLSTILMLCQFIFEKGDRSGEGVSLVAWLRCSWAWLALELLHFENEGLCRTRNDNFLNAFQNENRTFKKNVQNIFVSEEWLFATSAQPYVTFNPFLAPAVLNLSFSRTNASFLLFCFYLFS